MGLEHLVIYCIQFYLEIINMKAELYQFIVPIVSLVGIIISIRKYKRGINTAFETVLWTGLWLFISLVAILPDQTTFLLSKTIGIKDHINAIIFIGLAISFFLNFKLFNSLKKQNKLISDLVRKIAIENRKGNESNK